MSSRLFGYSLLLVVGAFALPRMAPTQQSNNNPAPTPLVKWEYKVVSLGSCASEGSVLAPLNSLGQQGWELVSYVHQPAPFPREADGSMIIAPAATGPSRDVSPPIPPTADSFAGTISMKMQPVAAPGCQMVFKREFHPPTRQ